MAPHGHGRAGRRRAAGPPAGRVRGRRRSVRRCSRRGRAEAPASRPPPADHPAGSRRLDRPLPGHRPGRADHGGGHQPRRAARGPAHLPAADGTRLRLLDRRAAEPAAHPPRTRRGDHGNGRCAAPLRLQRHQRGLHQRLPPLGRVAAGAGRAGRARSQPGPRVHRRRRAVLRHLPPFRLLRRRDACLDPGPRPPALVAAAEHVGVRRTGLPAAHRATCRARREDRRPDT